jgi:hypothetical protein
MDEYAFIEWAKLQADRRKLEREQGEAQRPVSAERGSIESHREPVRKQWFASQWRQQS